MIGKLSDETTLNFKSRKNLYHTYAKIYITHNNYLEFVGITRQTFESVTCSVEFDLLKKKYNLYHVPEFSYSLNGVFCLFLLSFFVYNFLQLYKDIHVLQGNLRPINKKS